MQNNRTPGVSCAPAASWTNHVQILLCVHNAHHPKKLHYNASRKSLSWQHKKGGGNSIALSVRAENKPFEQCRVFREHKTMMTDKGPSQRDCPHFHEQSQQGWILLSADRNLRRSWPALTPTVSNELILSLLPAMSCKSPGQCLSYREGKIIMPLV